MNLWRILVLLGGLTTFACASDPIASHPANAEIQRQISTIVAQVRTQGGAELMVSLHRLVAFDVFAVDQVASLAEDENARLRSNAMWVLAQICDPEQPARMERIEAALREGLDDNEPSVRYEAATGLAARGEWDVLVVLIEGLEDADPGVRYRCNQQLIATTSKDFGYSIDADPVQRGSAVAGWRSWYASWEKTRG